MKYTLTLMVKEQSICKWIFRENNFTIFVKFFCRIYWRCRTSWKSSKFGQNWRLYGYIHGMAEGCRGWGGNCLCLSQFWGHNHAWESMFGLFWYLFLVINLLENGEICTEIILLKTTIFQGSAAFWYDLTSIGYREQRSIHGGTKNWFINFFNS